MKLLIKKTAAEYMRTYLTKDHGYDTFMNFYDMKLFPAAGVVLFIWDKVISEGLQVEEVTRKNGEFYQFTFTGKIPERYRLFENV